MRLNFNSQQEIVGCFVMSKFYDLTRSHDLTRRFNLTRRNNPTGPTKTKKDHQ